MWEVTGYAVELAVAVLLVSKCRQWYFCCVLFRRQNDLEKKAKEWQ